MIKSVQLNCLSKQGITIIKQTQNDTQNKLWLCYSVINLDGVVMYHIEIMSCDNLSQHVFVSCFTVGLKRM